jgi:uncharacterized protein with HEPN domain
MIDAYKEKLAMMRQNLPLKGKTHLVFAEAQADIIFWRTLFDHVAFTEKQTILHFEFTTATRVADGCAEVLKYKHLVEPKFLLCIDSDTRYLLQHNDLFANGNKKDFMFHTYTYNIENHQCIATNLNKKALNYQIEFDFVAFFDSYNKIIEPVFWYWLYSELHNLNDYLFTNDGLKSVIGILSGAATDLSKNGENELQKIATQVQEWQDKVIAKFPNIDLEITKNHVKTQFPNLEKHFYHFLNGHIIYDNVVKQLFEAIKTAYYNKARKAILKDYQGQQKDNKLAELKNLVANELNYHALIKNSYETCFARPTEHCELLEKVLGDIRQYFVGNND